jgi:2-methylisocitrate lyase-like PEP mutase family enzyme
VCGLSIEDRQADGLYDTRVAVERLRAARSALNAVDANIVLVGRSEG